MSTPLSILKKYWKHDHFRPLQEDIINSVLKNQDTLALLPTGGGKSICFQVPALILDGLCVVITPLIALMNDQRTGDGRAANEAVRLRRIREDARRPISVNLAETIALSHELIKLADSAKRRR